jgi:hypothetical protein
MTIVGPVAGAIAAVAIGWISLRQRFYRQPFGDWGAVGLWLLVIALDVAAFLLAAGGYIASKGLPHQHPTTIINWILAGLAVPLAVRSPIRETTVRGTTRSVGVTFVYDWLRAVIEDPLDGKLAELRRQQEKKLAGELMKAGWTANGLLEELKDHLDHLQRRSAGERAKILAAAKNATRNLTPPDNLRGIIVAVQEARCGGFLAGLRKATPS